MCRLIFFRIATLEYLFKHRHQLKDGNILQLRLHIGAFRQRLQFPSDVSTFFLL
jgi:hypothetical protein